MKIATLGLFFAALAWTLSAHASLIYPLAFGFVLFTMLAVRRGNRLPSVLRSAAEGVHRISGLLVIFMLIGCLTGSWRACGTIPYIIAWGVSWVTPSLFALCAFILCGIVSILLGSCFGTSGTMGVILMLLARACGVDPALAAGAIISGTMVGDRCSHMSSSANLVATLCNTSVHRTVPAMWRTSFVPLLITALAYLVISLMTEARPMAEQTSARLAQIFVLIPWTLVPAFMALAVAFLPMKVTTAMGLSVLSAILVGRIVQDISIWEMLRCMIMGLPASKAGPEMAGGGLVSMLEVSVIVLISTSYARLFRLAGLLDGVDSFIERLARRIGCFRAMVVASIPTAAVGCNQTMSIVLMSETCRRLWPSRQAMAIPLEDSIVLTASLIPWSISVSVPLAILGEGAEAIPLILYIWVLPLYRCFFKDSRPPLQQ